MTALFSMVHLNFSLIIIKIDVILVCIVIRTFGMFIVSFGGIFWYEMSFRFMTRKKAHENSFSYITNLSDRENCALMKL